MTLRRLRAMMLAGIVAAATLALLAPLTPAAHGAALAAPGGLSVANKNTSTPIFSWTKVSKATGYQIQVDNDPGFGSPEYSVSTVNSRAVPTGNLRPGDNHWRVRATAGKETSSWSEGGLTVSPVGVPVPTAPGNNAVLPQPGSPPLLRWTGVQGATSYSVEVDGDDDFIGAKTYTTRTTSLVVPDPLVAGDWYWRVTAVKSAGIISVASPTYRFDVGALPSPTLVSPPDNVNVDIEDVVFDWQPVAGAKTYDLQVALDKGFNNVQLTASGIQSTRYSPPRGLNNDQFYWRVRAVDLNNQQTPWSASNFAFERVWPDQPQPVYPLGSVGAPAAFSNEAPYFQWTPVQHASHYELAVSYDSTFSPAQTEFCTVAGTTFTPRTPAHRDCGFRAGQPIWWKVIPLDRPYTNRGLEGQAASPAQGVTWGGHTVGAYDGHFETVTGLKIAMTGQGTEDPSKGCSTVNCTGALATPVLSWEHQPGAGAYMIYIGQDANYTTSEVNDIPITTNNKLALDLTDTVPTLPENEVGTSYYWYVRPCTTVQLSTCGDDPKNADLPGSHSFSKVSPPVVGLSSSDPSQNDITFSWEDYHTTNLGKTWNAEVGTQSAESYRIQVDTDTAFTAPFIDDAVVDQATYTAWNKLYPEGRLYWRVTARDVGDNDLAWSDPQTLVKSTPPPNLTSPANGSAVAGTTPFTWDAQAFASSYQVEVYRNNDAAFSPGNRVFAATVKTAAYAYAAPLPADNTPYTWRVRRLDSDGNAGPWSATGRFTSLGAVPQLLTPGNSTWQPSAGPLFEWSEVPGAASYALEVRVAGGTSNYLSVATVASAHAPVRAIASGDYTWRVTAFDAAGKSLGTSPARTFSIDAVPPAIKKIKPVRGKVKAKSDVIVKFTEAVTGVSKKSLYLKTSLKKKAKPLRAKVTLNKAKTVATVNPRGSFKKGKTYYLFATSKVTDLRGNPLPVGKEPVGSIER